MKTSVHYTSIDCKLKKHQTVVMSFNGWWKSDYSVLDSKSLDEIDEVVAGKVFKIRYLGCTNLDHNEDCDFSKTAEQILSNLPAHVLKRVPVLDLFVDSKLLSVRDTQTEENTLLEIPISDVRDILYRKNDSHYDKICIFVARYIPLRSNLKVHVVYCDTSDLAEQLFETFCRAFNVGRPKVRGSCAKLDIPVCLLPGDLKEKRYIAKETFVSTLPDVNCNSPST